MKSKSPIRPQEPPIVSPKSPLPCSPSLLPLEGPACIEDPLSHAKMRPVLQPVQHFKFYLVISVNIRVNLKWWFPGRLVCATLISTIFSKQRSSSFDKVSWTITLYDNILSRRCLSTTLRHFYSSDSFSQECLSQHSVQWFLGEISLESSRNFSLIE